MASINGLKYTSPTNSFTYAYIFEELAYAGINGKEINEYILDNFKSFDLDQSGGLTKSEVKQQIENVLADNQSLSNCKKKFNIHDDIYKKYVDIADLNNDGVVTQKELDTGIRVIKQLEEQNDSSMFTKEKVSSFFKDYKTNMNSGIESFNKADIDDDLFVSKNENLITSFAKPEMDINNDDKISLGEYVSYLHNGKDIDLTLYKEAVGNETAQNLAQYDINSDGKITQDEIKTVDYRANINSALKAFKEADKDNNLFVSRRENIASLFAKSEIDINNDNKISLGEYVSSLHNGKDIDLQSYKEAVGNEAAQNLAQYDANGDGKITQDEIKEYDNEKNGGLSTAEIVVEIIGCILVVGAIIALIVYLSRKKNKNKENNKEQADEEQQVGQEQGKTSENEKKEECKKENVENNFDKHQKDIEYNVSNNLNSINHSKELQR